LTHHSQPKNHISIKLQLYLKNLGKGPEPEVKYNDKKDEEGKPKHQKPYQNKPYDKEYKNKDKDSHYHPKPQRPKEPEKELDSDGFEVVDSTKKPKQAKEYQGGYQKNSNYKKKPYQGNKDGKGKYYKKKEGEKDDDDAPKLNEIGTRGEIKEEVKKENVESNAKGLNDMFK